MKWRDRLRQRRASNLATTLDRTAVAMGDQLWNARVKAKLNREQVAKLAGVHVRTIRAWEGGENMIQLAKFMTAVAACHKKKRR